jgi:UDPglucose 6-dehydrogenase
MDPGPPGNCNICCIGAGYVGVPTMAVLAARAPVGRVLIYDNDAAKIATWQNVLRAIETGAVDQPALPVPEPGLRNLLREGRLAFTADPGALAGGRVFFIAVGTPATPEGGYDLSAYEAAARLIAAHARGRVVVIEKSTVPVGTAERVRALIAACRRDPSLEAEVLSNPEFLAEGTAVRDLEEPDRVLIGALPTAGGAEAARLLAGLYSWVPPKKIIHTDAWTAELAKMASNAFLAQRVSSINAFAAVCDAAGADVEELALVVGADRRIGRKYLQAGIGFGGSCLAKDLRGLVYLCRRLGLPDIGAYWEGVLAMNEAQKARFVERVADRLFGTVWAKRIAVLGLAFKQGTGDTRDSAAVDVCRALEARGARLAVYDPGVGPAAVRELLPAAHAAGDAYEAAQGAHAVLILTDWQEFRGLDWGRVRGGLAPPGWVFDGRGVLDAGALRAEGLNVEVLGRPIRGQKGGPGHGP